VGQFGNTVTKQSASPRGTLRDDAVNAALVTFGEPEPHVPRKEVLVSGSGYEHGSARQFLDQVFGQEDSCQPGSGPLS
jgi:hypothetical protein